MKSANMSSIGERAAARVEQGWIQGTQHVLDASNKVVARCASEALLEDEKENDAVQALMELSTQLGTSLPLWNDTPGRKKEEVVALLKAYVPKPTLEYSPSEIARFMRNTHMMDDASARLYVESNGLFNFERLSQVMSRSTKMGPMQAMKSVVSEFQGEDRRIVRNAIMMIFGSKAARPMLPRE